MDLQSGLAACAVQVILVLHTGFCGVVGGQGRSRDVLQVVTIAATMQAALAEPVNFLATLLQLTKTPKPTLAVLADNAVCLEQRC